MQLYVLASFSGATLRLQPRLNYSQAAKPRFFVVNRCQAEKSHKRMGWEQRRSMFFIPICGPIAWLFPDFAGVTIFLHKYVCVYIYIFYLFHMFLSSFAVDLQVVGTDEWNLEELGLGVLSTASKGVSRQLFILRLVFLVVDLEICLIFFVNMIFIYFYVYTYIQTIQI